MRAARDFEAGHLRVSSVLPFFIIDMVTAFREQYPKVKISVSSGNSTTTLTSLLAYESDAGILADHQPDQRLFTHRYDSHHVVAIISCQRPWADRNSIHLAELHGQPMVLREVGSNTRRAFEAATASAGVTPDVIMEIESGEAVREAVAKGHGLGIYGELSLPVDPRLQVLRFIDAEMQINRYLACLKERRNELLVEAFFNVSKQTR